MDEEAWGAIIAIIAIVVIAAIVIGLLLTVGIVLLIGTAAVGGACGIYQAARNFWLVLGEAHGAVPRQSAPGWFRRFVEPQPAYILYPCARGWLVVRHVTNNVFGRTGKTAQNWFDLGQKCWENADSADNVVTKYWQGCCAVGLYLAGASQYATAMVMVALFTLLYVVAMVGWLAGALIGIGAVVAVSRAYSAIHRLFYRCPGCHESMAIPVFYCPMCGTEHTRLWPSLYGVLHHGCANCGGTRLSTVEWLGRRALARSCPHCHRPLNADIGSLTNLHVPVVGGPSTGKSNFIVMATDSLMGLCRATGRAEVTFPDEQDERDFQANVERLRHGRELLKTTSIVPQAYNLSIRPAGSGVGTVLYFYDAAGEAYNDEASAQQQTYFRWVDSIIFIVDPCALPDVQVQFHGAIDEVRTALRPSLTGVMETYERMLTVLESSVGLRRGQRFPHPIAVVVTKTDALDLEARIGRQAARERMARDPSIKSEADAIDSLVRDFLGGFGMDHLVRDMELQFSHVRFFSCSALGRMPDPRDTRPYDPLRVVDPLAWVLERTGTLRGVVPLHTVPQQEPTPQPEALPAT